MADYRHFDAEEPTEASATGVWSFLICCWLLRWASDSLTVVKGGALSWTMNEWWDFGNQYTGPSMGDLWYFVLTTAALAIYHALYRKRWLGRLGKFLGFLCAGFVLMPLFFLASVAGIVDHTTFGQGPFRTQWFLREAMIAREQAEVVWGATVCVCCAGALVVWCWWDMPSAEDGISAHQARKAAKKAQEAEGDT